ncbi:MAG: diguanylate cyclase domain-containing protein, partial [Saezia sp.]
QRVDFMGDFAEAFNTMTEQLDFRQNALNQEMQKTKRKARALEQSNSLLEAITDRIPQWIIVMGESSKEMMFLNRSADIVFDKGGPLVDSLRDWLANQTERHSVEPSVEPAELVLAYEGKIQYYSVISYPIQWKERGAVAHVFTNISAEKEQVLKLENYAYQDTLTSIHNRFFGMQMLREWMEEGRHFCICFSDLDNLKYVNDNYGHQEGDRYIVQAAQYLLGFDSGSLACRLGGDEFMVLADDYTQQEAEIRMEELRTEMIEKNLKEKNPYLCSLSYGVVEVQPDNTQSASDLLGIADERMYKYKRAHSQERRTAVSKGENPL